VFPALHNDYYARAAVSTISRRQAARDTTTDMLTSHFSGNETKGPNLA
jgi:hypothetical protein